MELTLEEQNAVRAVQPVQHAKHQLATSSPAGIMMAALERGISPADMREMLALQREWQADQARAAFNEALAAFKAEPIVLAKSKKVGYEDRNGNWVGYTHAELSDVVAAAGPALSKHGLSHRWDVKQSPEWISVTCILSHKLGHSESVEMGGPPDNSGKKNPIQQIASTITYLQRYTLKAITGLAEGGQDDDGQGGPDAPGTGQGGENLDPPRAKREPATGQSDGLPPYPAESFAKNLPTWRKGIEAGRKSVDDVISTLAARFTLSDEQLAAIRAA